MNDLRRIAVVIDADNTQLLKIGDVLREVSTYGRIVVKRAYGNWRRDTLKNWEAEIKRLAIKPVQQFDYVPKKNATDIALVIDTIDLLHTKGYDAFVIVSSDCDYTPLAIRIRESGVFVIGVGEMKTPGSFRNACDEFLLLENISAGSVPPAVTPASAKASNTGHSVPTALESEAKNTNHDSLAHSNDSDTCCSEAEEASDGIDEIHGLLRRAYIVYQEDNGFANVASVGSFIKRTKPDFDCRTYGYEKLPQLLAGFPEKYEMTRYPGKGTVTIVAYRCID